MADESEKKDAPPVEESSAPITAAGEQMPPTRAGEAGTRGGGTEGKMRMELRMPMFRNTEERIQWLKGKPSRQELRDDMKALSDGFVYLTGLVAKTDDKLEGFLRYLVGNG